MEINVSLVWERDRGFQTTFGYPAVAKKRFKTSGEAVRWLNEQANYLRTEFPPDRDQVDVDAEAILDNLYGNQIDGSFEWIWDGGFFVSLGAQDRKRKCWSVETVAKAVEWLKETACSDYPESEFARKYGGFV
jgi:hypothetical protein